MKTLAASLCLALIAAVCAAGEKTAGCPPAGDAAKAKVRALNEKKASLEEPAEDDIDDTVTAEALVEPGDDRLRWQDGQAAEVTVYVQEVRDGGMRSSNCHAADPADQDTILDVSTSDTVFDKAHRMIAVITPQWRRALAGDRVDWSTRAIRAKYLHRYVTMDGWLLFNFEGAFEAVNTAPLPGARIRRATAWEIHPVTSIDNADDAAPEQTRLTPDRRPEIPILAPAP